MKLALYLLSCCIAASWQQQNHRYGGYPYRAHQYQFGRPLSHYSGPYYPDFYSYPYYSNYFYPSSPYHKQSENQQSPNKQQSPLNEEKAIQILLMRLLFSQRLKQLEAEKEQKLTNEEDEDSDGIVVHGQHEEDNNQAMARVKNRQWFNKKPDQVSGDETESRAFFLPNFLLKNQVLGTSTYYSFTTSTVTITTIYSCIKASSFYGGSSQACRKRRGLAKLNHPSDEEHVDGSLLNPTPVESIETTPVVESPIVPRSTELDSSLYLQQARAENNPFLSITGLYGKTSTSTVTKYSISTSVSYRTVSLGSNLSCLPSGFSVC